MKLNEIIERKASELFRVQEYTAGLLDISRCELTSLEGCPEIITNEFNCSRNSLSSFEFFPKYVEYNCFISFNKFKSFKDIDKYAEHIGGTLIAYGMDIHRYSDLFSVKFLHKIEVDNQQIRDIVNKWLPSKDLIEFQDEMIKSGFESYL